MCVGELTMWLFSSYAGIMGKGLMNNSALTLFFSLFFFLLYFFFLEISSRAPLFGAKDQSTAAQKVEKTVNERSLASCVRSRFPDGFPHAVQHI